MEREMENTLQELAEITGGSVVGDASALISGIASLEEASPSDLVLIANRKFLRKAAQTSAGGFLVGANMEIKDRNLLRVENPKLAFAQLLSHFYPPETLPPGIHPTALVDSRASVDPTASVGALVFIGPGCRIQADCRIFPGSVLLRDVTVGPRTVIYCNVSIYSLVEIGSDVTIHSGSVIGSDGYGFVFDGKEHRKIPQVGGVRIGNKVEIGANCCIDRATLGMTLLGDGVKLDNSVHIGHNCVIGEHSLLVAQVGLSGGTRVGKHVTLAGQVGTNPQVEIGDGAVVTGKAGVSRNVPANTKVSGMPPLEHDRWVRAQILYARLPEIYETLKTVEREVKELKSNRGQK
jgi:UDP-3-O-[3-hydroxymyristoyl] glucosamine N-acyltransferase